MLQRQAYSDIIKSGGTSVIPHHAQYGYITNSGHNKHDKYDRREDPWSYMYPLLGDAVKYSIMSHDIQWTDFTVMYLLTCGIYCLHEFLDVIRWSPCLFLLMFSVTIALYTRDKSHYSTRLSYNNIISVTVLCCFLWWIFTPVCFFLCFQWQYCCSPETIILSYLSFMKWHNIDCRFWFHFIVIINDEN